MTDQPPARIFLAADGTTFTDVGYADGGIVSAWPDPPDGCVFDVEALRRGLQGGAITVSAPAPGREITGRIAFRHPAAGIDPARLVGARVDSLTLYGVNLAGTGQVIVSAAPIEGEDNLWIVAEKREVKTR